MRQLLAVSPSPGCSQSCIGITIFLKNHSYNVGYVRLPNWDIVCGRLDLIDQIRSTFISRGELI